MSKVKVPQFCFSICCNLSSSTGCISRQRLSLQIFCHQKVYIIINKWLIIITAISTQLHPIDSLNYSNLYCSPAQRTCNNIFQMNISAQSFQLWLYQVCDLELASTKHPGLLKAILKLRSSTYLNFEIRIIECWHNLFSL